MPFDTASATNSFFKEKLQHDTAYTPGRAHTVQHKPPHAVPPVSQYQPTPPQPTAIPPAPHHMPRSPPPRRFSATAAVAWLLLSASPAAAGRRQDHFRQSEDCLDAPTVASINSRFSKGGAGHAIVLCQYSHVTLDPKGPAITFTAPGQALYTLGLPEVEARATIAIAESARGRGGMGGYELTTAIRADCEACAGARIRNVVVDGGRQELGGVEGGDALIVIGGDGVGASEVRNVEALQARGFAIVHVAAGAKGLCSGATVADSYLHSSGDEPSDVKMAAALSALRNGPPPWRGHERMGLFTDAVSVACAQTTVHANTIADVSGVGIALRGAYSSQVTQNAIAARDRDLLAGIALVANPKLARRLSGGVVIRENRIHAQSAFIRIALAVGTGPWATDEMPGQHQVPAGSEVVNNRVSSDRGYFGYAVAISDARGIVVEGNSVSAVLSGYETASCFTRPAFVPSTPLLRDPTSTTGIFQPDFMLHKFGFLLCVGPASKATDGELSRHEIGKGSSVPRTKLGGGRKMARGAIESPFLAGRMADGPSAHMDGEWRRRAMMQGEVERGMRRVAGPRGVKIGGSSRALGAA